MCIRDSFNTLKYSSQAIQTEEDEEPYFMVKLEQELSLDSNEIFEWVERLSLIHILRPFCIYSEN